MRMDRRSFLRGLVGTAAGVLVAPEVLTEPERRVWALDNTMARSPIPAGSSIHMLPDWIAKLEPHDTPMLNYFQKFEYAWPFNYGDVLRIDNELVWVGHDTIYRAQAGTELSVHNWDASVALVGNAQPIPDGGFSYPRRRLV